MDSWDNTELMANALASVISTKGSSKLGQIRIEFVERARFNELKMAFGIKVK